MIVHPAPSASELEQYGEAVAAGIDPEMARQEIWPARPRVEAILSLVHPEGHNDPLVVGWTTCGSCIKHIRSCTCHNGPVEPTYITAWRPAPPRAEPTPVDSRRKLGDESYLSDLQEA